jgi:hypothetical protein
MLTAYFDPAGRRIRALRDSSAEFLFDGFANALSGAGYATITARRYLRAAEHFIYWSDRNRRPVQDVDEKCSAQACQNCEATVSLARHKARVPAPLAAHLCISGAGIDERPSKGNVAAEIADGALQRDGCSARVAQSLP